MVDTTDLKSVDFFSREGSSPSAPNLPLKYNYFIIMCICLNCEYLKICKQYNFIEKKHFEETITIEPFFVPTNSITIVNFHSSLNNVEIEWDMFECISFKEKPANWFFE